MASVPTWGIVQSPLGPLLLTSDGSGLTGLFFEHHVRRPPLDPAWPRNDRFFTGVRDQLDAYFAGRLDRFDVALAPRGTAFQTRVWAALTAIPFGRTVTYGELAARLGAPTASRAVGLANGRNPISIIVPCHRVVGASGKLTGYAGGLEAKRRLLDLEAGVIEHLPHPVSNAALFPPRPSAPGAL